MHETLLKHSAIIIIYKVCLITNLTKPDLSTLKDNFKVFILFVSNLLTTDDALSKKNHSKPSLRRH